MKKVFIISSILLGLVLSFIGVYTFAFRHNPTDPVADPEKKKELEQAVKGSDSSMPKLAPLITGSVIGLGATAEHLVYYSPTERAFKQTDLDGRNGRILLGDLSGSVQRVVWSPNMQHVLFQSQMDGKKLWYTASLDDKKIVALKPELSRLAWTNVGDNILYQYTDPTTGKNSLNMAESDGSNWKKISDLGEGDYFIAPIPQSSQLSVWPRPNGLIEGKLETLSIVGESRATIVDGRFGTDFLWSPNGEWLLVGSTREQGGAMPTLGITNSRGGEYHDLLMPTLISKVVWSHDNRTLFLALPSAFPHDSVIPNDYFGKPIFTTDTFWKIDVANGKRERLVELPAIPGSLDATNLVLTPDERSLYFIDRSTGKVYAINL